MNTAISSDGTQRKPKLHRAPSRLQVPIHTALIALSHACFLVTYPITSWLGAANLTGAAIALLVISAVAGVVAVVLARSRPRRESTTGDTVNHSH